MHQLRIFWIEAPRLGRIAVMPRPHPQSFGDLKAAGVDVVVSLLEAEEAAYIGLGDEAGLAASAGIEFLHLPVIDHGVPASHGPVIAMSSKITQRLADGKGVAVHCFAGLGRSPLLIAAVMIDSGYGAIDACDLISVARGRGVPERNEQADWLMEYERRRRGW